MSNRIFQEAKNVNNVLVVGLLAFAVLSFVSTIIGTGVVLSAIMAGAVCVYQLVDRPNIPSQEEILVANEERSKKAHKKRTLWSVVGPYFSQKKSNHRARMRVMHELDNMGLIALYLKYKADGRLNDLLGEEDLEYSKSAFPIAAVVAAAVATGAVSSARADVQQSAQQNVSNSTTPVELTPGGFPAVKNTTPTEEDFLGINDEPEIIPDVVDCTEEPECCDESVSTCDGSDDDYMFDDDDLYYA